jgi:hypothetical protein
MHEFSEGTGSIDAPSVLNDGHPKLSHQPCPICVRVRSGAAVGYLANRRFRRGAGRLHRRGLADVLSKEPAPDDAAQFADAFDHLNSKVLDPTLKDYRHA